MVVVERVRNLIVVGLTALLIAGAAAAQTKVYVTGHGKRYHTKRDCISLQRAR